MASRTITLYKNEPFSSQKVPGLQSTLKTDVVVLGLVDKTKKIHEVVTDAYPLQKNEERGSHCTEGSCLRVNLKVQYLLRSATEGTTQSVGSFRRVVGQNGENIPHDIARRGAAHTPSTVVAWPDYVECILNDL